MATMIKYNTKKPKRIVLFSIIIILIAIYTTNSFALGIGSNTKNIDLIPGTSKQITFYVINDQKQEGPVNIYISGLLKENIEVLSPTIEIYSTQKIYGFDIIIDLTKCIKKQKDMNTYISAELVSEDKNAININSKAMLILDLNINETLFCNNSENITFENNNKENNTTEIYQENLIPQKQEDSQITTKKTPQQIKKSSKEDINLILIIIIVVILIVILISSMFVFDFVYIKKLKIKKIKNQNKNTNETIDDYTKSLRSYIKKMKSNGYNREKIKQSLLNVGWKEEMIDKEIDKFFK